MSSLKIPMKFPETGLYAITQTEGKTHTQIVNDVSSAIKGGAEVIQYRNKQLVDSVSLAVELQKICHFHHVPFIINDDIDLALQVGADGVHLGKNDANIKQAHEQLGSDAIIGVSCYNSIIRARKALNDGATYVAFGRFFPSYSKPLAAPAEIDTLRKAKATLQIPIVAIGGILPGNGRQLLDAGADLLAVIGGVFDKDPEQSARAYSDLFSSAQVS